MDDDPAFETIPESRGKINNLFTMYSMSGDPEDFEELVDYEYNVGLITAFADVMSTEQIFSYTKRLNNHIDKNVKRGHSHHTICERGSHVRCSRSCLHCRMKVCICGRRVVTLGLPYN